MKIPSSVELKFHFEFDWRTVAATALVIAAQALHHFLG
jgi:hypothetical protein